jgi:uncharacterized LabA/DUF88 family protein
MQEPLKKRVVSFFDCQNLFKSASALWNYSFPNFDPLKLSRFITSKYRSQGWYLTGMRLYTGIHDAKINPIWHDFWMKKLIFVKSIYPQVFVFTSPLRYDKNGVAREKGIDVRIALDLIRLARKNEFDVAMLFSQDNDFSEAANEIRSISKEYDRWIKIVSVFPCNQSSIHTKGVRQTDWLPVSRSEYDSCIDPVDYRNKT